MSWASVGLAVVCLAVGLFHLARLAVRRRDGASELAYAAMGLGMATMYSPLGDPAPDPVWTVVYALVAVRFGAAVLRSRTLSGDAGHHVVGSGAMLLMLNADPAGHAAHVGVPAGRLGMASVAALALTGYFAWHALRCADGCRSPEPAEVDATASPGAAAVAVRTPTWTLDAPQTAAAAQLVMAVVMAFMLLSML